MIKKAHISKWYFAGLFVWGLIVFLRKSAYVIPHNISNHLTDLYSVPMYCYTIQIIMNMTFKPFWKPDFKFIMYSAINLSIVFEVVCPLISTKFTGDYLDIICYFSGGLLYYFGLKIINR